MRILDLGCGTGELAKYLNGRGNSVIGLDLSEKMIRIAKMKAISLRRTLWPRCRSFVALKH